MGYTGPSYSQPWGGGGALGSIGNCQTVGKIIQNCKRKLYENRVQWWYIIASQIKEESESENHIKYQIRKHQTDLTNSQNHKTENPMPPSLLSPEGVFLLYFNCIEHSRTTQIIFNPYHLKSMRVAFLSKLLYNV